MQPQSIPSTDATRARIKEELSATRRQALWLAVPSLGGPLAFGVTQWFNPKNDSTGQLVGLVVLTALMMLIFGLIPWGIRESAQQLEEDLEMDHVLELRGTITEKRWSKYTPRQVRIEGTWLRLPMRHYHSLSVGSVVRIRYTPKAMLILKLERLSG